MQFPFLWTDTSPIIAHTLYKLKKLGLILVQEGNEMEQKIKQDGIIHIGQNIRRIRKERGIGQTELIGKLQLLDVPMTRETLVKIERGIQHIQLEQLKGIKQVLKVTYEDLLD